jgi:outer membrane protein with beta-barrel domain
MSVKMVTASTALACLLCAAVATPAAAQTARTELSAGYQFTRTPDLNLPPGWYIDVAGNVAPMFAIVGEVSGAYKSESIAVGTSSVDATVRLHTFMGGVRVAARTSPRVVPFGQVLLGAARLSGGVTASGPATSVLAATDADTEFALQFGGGVNLMMSRNFGVRLGADYRRIFISDGGENEFRLGAGVVIPFGQ